MNAGVGPALALCATSDRAPLTPTAALPIPPAPEVPITPTTESATTPGDAATPTSTAVPVRPLTPALPHAPTRALPQSPTSEPPVAPTAARARMPTTVLPLVYSCSGCSSAAQMANHLALQLDRGGVAEMSCIAGVGGDVPALLKLAGSGRRIVAIDGCALACARACLARHALTPELHLQLGELGVKKRQHADFCPDQANDMLALASAMIARQPRSEPT
jgi:uncharacterized metal-binding protein